MLDQKYIDQLEVIFRGFPNLEKVVVFGSRARKDNKPKSDIDLCVWGLSEMEKAELQNQLEERTTIPFFIDLVRFEGISSPEFRGEVLGNGLGIYSR